MEIEAHHQQERCSEEQHERPTPLAGVRQIYHHCNAGYERRDEYVVMAVESPRRYEPDGPPNERDPEYEYTVVL